MKWQPENGKAKELCEIDDIHLANIYFHARWYHYDFDIADEIGRELKRRKLPPSFVAGAPYPFVDKDGKARIWDFEKKTSALIRQKKANKSLSGIYKHMNYSLIFDNSTTVEVDWENKIVRNPVSKKICKVWNMDDVAGFVDNGIWIRVDNPKIKPKHKHGWVLYRPQLKEFINGRKWVSSICDAGVFKTRAAARSAPRYDPRFGMFLKVKKVELDDSGRATKFIK